MSATIENDTIIRLLLRRGTEAERQEIILDQAEAGFTLDGKQLFVGDGRTLGGNVIPRTDNASIEWAGTTPNYIQLKNGGVTNSKLASVSANSVKGNNTASDSTPTDIVISENSVVGRLDTVNSGNLTSISISTLIATIFSTTKPSASISTVWVDTATNRVYTYDGVNWLSPHQYEASGSIRILYVGTGASVATFDGGDTNAASVSGGPMWEVDTDYTSKMLRGAADGASATTPLKSAGADTVSMVASMIPPHTHNVKILIPGHGGDDGSRDAADGGRWSSPNSSDPTFTGPNDGTTSGKYLKDSYNLPRVYEDYGNGNTSTSTPVPIPTLPAYKEVLVLKRTSRVYYVG